MDAARIEENFRAFFDMALSPALMLDCNLTIVTCNAAYEKVAHVTRAAIVGRPVFEVFPGSSVRETQTLRDSYDRVLNHRKPHHIAHMQYATAVPNNTGLQERHWTVSNMPLLLADGTLFGILHYPADITELTQLRHANQSVRDTTLDHDAQESIQRWTRNVQNILHSEKERLRQLFQRAPSFICVLNGPNHVFDLVNDAYYQLVGHRDIINHRVADVLPEVVAQGFLNKLDNVFATGTPFIGRAMSIELQRSAGGELEQRYIDLIYQPIFDSDGAVTGIFAQGSDVTEAYTLAQELTYQAAHDSLTGLCNRRELSRQTQNADNRSTHALLYMDIDHLKIVNDRCGHAAGDSLLIKIAAALQSQCDHDHDLLARLGGDEFALVRRDCTQEAAIALANRLCRSVKDIIFIEQGNRYSVTLSIGIVNFGEPEQLDFEAALGLADAACFLAKEKGRNRYQVSSASDEEVKRQHQDMDNVTRLKEAMRQDRIILYAQRIVGLQPHADPRPAFYEVLARLRDLNGAIIAPSGFIPAAERFGMIEELDRHIVCKTFAHLQAQRPERRDGSCYFINLSGITLSGREFLIFIENTLLAYPAVRASQICFEVTETAALSNVHRTIEAMRQLITMGFKFALDDFGSGMASFAYLSQLPVQFVKIDGEFVKTILSQPAGGIIVEAVAKVARTMNMTTIAESVEFDELIPELRSIGIDYAQGYALHLPEPI
jgi:diguanylate cyclase (GGDEF)-like protein/PAS domain S-box-containing protein